MTLLDDLLALLADGRWHTLQQVISKLNASQFVVEEAAIFLARYGIIEYDERERRIRITPQTKRWLELLRGRERKISRNLNNFSS